MVQKTDGINGQKSDGMVQKTDGIYNGQKADGMVQKTDGINGQKADSMVQKAGGIHLIDYSPLSVLMMVVSILIFLYFS
jgi:hypothetical protein